MAMNFQEIYQKLYQENSSAADIFSGETAKELAPNRRAWLFDRCTMQEGYHWMQDALAQSEGLTREQLRAQLEILARQLVDSALDQYPTDAEKKMYLVAQLSREDESLAEDLGNMSRSSLKRITVQQMLVLMKVILSKLADAVDKIEELSNADDTEVGVSAPAAAVALSFTAPAASMIPGVMGAAAGGMDYCKLLEQGSDILLKICAVLAIIALVASAFLLLAYGAGAIGTGVAHVLKMKTVEGVGAAIAADHAIIAELYAPLVELIKYSGIASAIAGAATTATSLLNEAFGSPSASALNSDAVKARKQLAANP